MRLAVATVAATILSCGVAVEGRGQDDAQGGVGWGPGSAYGRLFDPATIETVRGEVTAVDLVNPRKGMACGVCLTLRAEAESLTVHLGPEWHISRQEVGLDVHDQVEVTGSRILFKGEPVIIAAKLRKGDETLVLRDVRGVPVWSGWRRGR